MASRVSGTRSGSSEVAAGQYLRAHAVGRRAQRRRRRRLAPHEKLAIGERQEHVGLLVPQRAVHHGGHLHQLRPVQRREEELAIRVQQEEAPLARAARLAQAQRHNVCAHGGVRAGAARARAARAHPSPRGGAAARSPARPRPRPARSPLRKQAAGGATAAATRARAHVRDWRGRPRPTRRRTTRRSTAAATARRLVRERQGHARAGTNLRSQPRQARPRQRAPLVREQLHPAGVVDHQEHPVARAAQRAAAPRDRGSARAWATAAAAKRRPSSRE